MSARVENEMGERGQTGRQHENEDEKKRTKERRTHSALVTFDVVSLPFQQYRSKQPVQTPERGTPERARERSTTAQARQTLNRAGRRRKYTVSFGVDSHRQITRAGSKALTTREGQTWHCPADSHESPSGKSARTCPESETIGTASEPSSYW